MRGPGWQRGHGRRVAVGLAVSLLGLAGGCAGDTVAVGAPPRAVLLRGMAPGTVLPRSTVLVQAENFSESARHFLKLEGSIAGRHVERIVPLAVVGAVAKWAVDDKTFTAVGEGVFNGTAEVTSRTDYHQVTGPKLIVRLHFVRYLDPELNAVGDGMIYLNSEVRLHTSDLLLGGAEGSTVAELVGCFQRAGAVAECGDGGQQVSVRLPVAVNGGERISGTFPYAPSIAGVLPGRFAGTVTLVNEHADGTARRSVPRAVRFDLQPSRLSGLVQPGVSLGQFLDFDGLGFIGSMGGNTAIRFDGRFIGDEGSNRKLQFEIVTTYQRGDRVRYVLEEERGVGALIELRQERGVLSGSWTPVLRYGTVVSEGDPLLAAVRVLPVKQVVWVRFTDGWQDALRLFGLKAADKQIRGRIHELLRSTYEGLNVEFREQQPDDFKLYARVDVVGHDPTRSGQFGYEATRGKDQGNRRLDDVIGGVNAELQQSGLPGYGGIFAGALLELSEHPPAGMRRHKLHSPLFDRLFDPFRPDVGLELSTAEALYMPLIEGTAGCPASDRPTQAACAVVAFANMVGHTAAHEFAHSLGLAKPDNGSVVDSHNSGDLDNRLMDGGMERPFVERAQIDGRGPAVFCKESWSYLKRILPAEGDPVPDRPFCD